MHTPTAASQLAIPARPADIFARTATDIRERSLREVRAAVADVPTSDLDPMVPTGLSGSIIDRLALADNLRSRLKDAEGAGIAIPVAASKPAAEVTDPDEYFARTGRFPRSVSPKFTYRPEDDGRPRPYFLSFRDELNLTRRGVAGAIALAGLVGAVMGLVVGAIAWVILGWSLSLWFPAGGGTLFGAAATLFLGEDIRNPKRTGVGAFTAAETTAIAAALWAYANERKVDRVDAAIVAVAKQRVGALLTSRAWNSPYLDVAHSSFHPQAELREIRSHAEQLSGLRMRINAMTPSTAVLRDSVERHQQQLDVLTESLLARVAALHRYVSLVEDLSVKVNELDELQAAREIDDDLETMLVQLGADEVARHQYESLESEIRAVDDGIRALTGLLAAPAIAAA